MERKFKEKTKGKPTPIDEYVGRQLRVRRSVLGLSQEKLAEKVNLTFQQIQKYENGVNRISASRLYEFSKVLEVPIAYFFEGYIPKKPSNISHDKSMKMKQADLGNALEKKETFDLVYIYYSVTDQALRKLLLQFIKSVAENLKGNRSQSGNSKGKKRHVR